MIWIAQNVWLIPALPLLAAGLSALMKQRHRRLAASLAIGSMGLAFVLACVAFAATLGAQGGAARQVHNFDWFVLGETSLQLGWVLDPLTASMLVMVTFVGGLIFIYSIGYMAHDENFTRFFCFLALFAAAMLGVVIANSLLLLFICWELVGFTSGATGASTTFTPGKFNFAAPAALGNHGCNYTTEPTTITTANSGHPVSFGFNQRGGMRWAVPQGEGVKYSFSGTEKLWTVQVLSSAAGTVTGTAHFWQGN